MIIGSVYRHHTTVQSFLDTFFRKALQFITKSQKTCIIGGDFNIDLIQYGYNKKIYDFYDELSTHSFRPLILQPSRVTPKNRTLIDNIYVNDLSSFSSGENLTTYISDHFGKISQIDIFQSAQGEKKTRFGRNWHLLTKMNLKKNLTNLLGIMWHPPKKTLTRACQNILQCHFTVILRWQKNRIFIKNPKY